MSRREGETCACSCETWPPPRCSLCPSFPLVRPWHGGGVDMQHQRRHIRELLEGGHELGGKRERGRGGDLWVRQQATRGAAVLEVTARAGGGGVEGLRLSRGAVGAAHRMFCYPWFLGDRVDAKLVVQVQVQANWFFSQSHLERGDPVYWSRSNPRQKVRAPPQHPASAPL